MSIDSFVGSFNDYTSNCYFLAITYASNIEFENVRPSWISTLQNKISIYKNPIETNIGPPNPKGDTKC